MPCPPQLAAHAFKPGNPGGPGRPKGHTFAEDVLELLGEEVTDDELEMERRSFVALESAASAREFRLAQALRNGVAGGGGGAGAAAAWPKLPCGSCHPKSPCGSDQPYESFPNSDVSPS